MLGERGSVVGLDTALPAFASRLRFQLPGVILFAVVLPVLLRGHAVSAFLQTSLLDAGGAAVLAVILACYFIRRVRDFPGVQSGAHIPLAVTGAFTVALVVLLLFRLQYSRGFLIASFLFALFWFVVLHVVTERLARPVVALVPGGHASEILHLDRVRWREISGPEELGQRHAAIAVDLRQEFSPAWERALTEATLAGTPVYHSKTLSESLTGQVEIERLYENNFGSMLPSLAYLKLKALGDWLLALAMLPPFVVVALAAGAAILVDSGFPIFYRQERVGYRGRVFQVWKFRTMAARQQRDDERRAAVTRNADARVTRVGRALRRYRIDELPQILNILRGEMSWIGPRPEARALSEWYEAELPYYRYRHAVRPGISGWAQVNQGHVATPADVHTKLNYDFFYIKYLSPWLDMLIVLKTVQTVLSGFGAR